MTKQTPEGKIKDQIKADLKVLGIFSFMAVAGAFGTRGQSDHTLCVCGLFVACEAKKGKARKPTEQQTFRMQEARQSGGASMCVHADNIAYFKPTLIAVINTWNEYRDLELMRGVIHASPVGYTEVLKETIL